MKAVATEQLAQVHAVHARQPGSGRNVALGLLQKLPQILTLEGFHSAGLGHPEGLSLPHWILDVTHGEEALDAIAQLANVARPGIADEELEQRGGQRALAAAELRSQPFGDERNVFWPLAQRR